MSPFVITGAGGGSVNRLEINDFVNNEKFFSLYIQALQAMSTEDQIDLQSFFSIGGIHGLPNQPWDGVTGDSPFDPDSGQWGGYCTHGSVIFPTWHRPYVMLYEQVLQKRAEEIAATYTVDTEDWKQAASNLRQPFWDWASNAIPPDEVIALQQVTITKNDGTRVKVDNPLFHYKFNPIDPSFPAPYSGWQTTLRQPTSTDSNATDDIAMLKSVLASAQTGITANTYNMLTRVQTWPAFSNHTVGDGGSTSNSLEAIHDGIHVDVGGQGQMADPSVAGLDPIFFLHHANVDRLLSMWAAINPGVWVSAGITEDGGSFTSPPGVPIDQTTSLTPFRSDQTTFWPSAAVGDTSKLGYTYPDFNGVDLGNTDAVKSAISNRVNQLYGSSVFGTSSLAAAPSSIPAPVRGLADQAKKVPVAPPSNNAATPQHPAIPTAVRSLADTPAKTPAPVPSHNPAAPQQHTLSTQVTEHARAHSHHHLHHSHPAVHEQSSAPPDHGFWDWTARIEFKKYELGTSFSVLIFLGQVPENPRELRISPNYVGGHHAFVNSSPSTCANCSDQRDLVIEGFVHLNHAIAKHSGLGSLEPNVIEPYLTNNLEWRVQKSNGEVVELESLEVTVIATPLTYPPNAIFPVPGQPSRFNQITYGRPGGSRQP